jgi:hypothetical protein
MDVFSGVDVQTMLFGIVFVIIFALLMILLGRVKIFQKNQGTKTVVGICVSLLSIYGISKSSWDLEGFFYSLGFGQDMIYNFVLLAIIAFFIITMMVRDEITGRTKFRLYRPMILLGIIFIALRFSPWSNSERTLLVGIPLFLIGAFFWNLRRRRTSKEIERTPNLRLLGR